MPTLPNTFKPRMGRLQQRAAQIKAEAEAKKIAEVNERVTNLPEDLTAASTSSMSLRTAAVPGIDTQAAFIRLSNCVLRLNEELSDARSQLARYGESLLAIQRSILPQRMPEVGGLDLAVHFSEADGVGGDFYDVRPVGPDHWAIVIADVCGHGLAAAATLALVHALGNAVEGQPGPTAPGAALALINKPLATRYLANTGQFVTAFVGLYEPDTQMLTYAAAGHPPPRLVRGSEVRRIDGVGGLPLGLDNASVYEERIVQLLPGDRLVFFTDGITESTNAGLGLFGDERLDAILRAPASAAADLLSRIVGAVQTFRAGHPVTDDETCLVAVVRAGASEAQVQQK